MFYKLIFTWLVVLFSVFVAGESALANLIVQSESAVGVEITGYDALVESSICKVNLAASSRDEITTPYRGLALLVFAGGQRYPLIIGDESFALKITDPFTPPSFEGSPENDIFYKSLTGGDLPPAQYAFARLMIQAKNLIQSSQTVKSIKELTSKKTEFHEFVGTHYDALRHSDMIKRLMAQYFMMHEYVDYRTEGVSATEIKARYQSEVVNGVRSWLAVLKPKLPEQAVLNYCVSLYYQRSMVTLAALIVENFRDSAYCPGPNVKTVNFPEDLFIAQTGGSNERKLADIKGNKLIAFVSDDCPVSMVETVIKARRATGQKEPLSVIVAPLQTLSDRHLSMAGMVSGGNIFFINDEQWRKANLPEKMKLPLFVRLGNDPEK